MLQQGKLAPAEVLFQEITTSQPKLAGPWVNLGLIALAQQDVTHAQSMFESALKANPNNCDALNQMGILARTHGDFQGAEGFYKQCLSHNPHRHDVQLNLGILYELYMGRLGDALIAYQAYQAQSIEPNQMVTGWVMDLERRLAALASR